MESRLLAALLIAIGHGQAGGGLLSLAREVHHLRLASALSAKQPFCSTWPGCVGCVKSLRGGSEALHSPDFGPLETRLAGLEQMQAQGHLSEAEVLAERERLLLESASRNLDLQQAAGRTPTSGEARERQNMTIARCANDNLARALAERPQHLECADGSAGHGLVRPDGRVSFSAGERAAWRRRSARLAAEEAAGLHSHCCGKSRDDPAVLAQCRARMQLGDNRLFPYWAAATQALCRANARGQREPGSRSVAQGRVERGQETEHEADCGRDSDVAVECEKERRGRDSDRLGKAVAGAPEAEAYAETRQRLNCSTFVPRVDLAAGSYLVLTAGNCTGPPTKTEVRVESSPYGKVTRVEWLPDVRSINVSLAQAVWAQEPITLWFPAHSNIFLDPLVCPDNPNDLLEDLFASPALLPPAGSIGDAEAEAMPETHEELERIRAGTVMRLVGLRSAPHYNGRRVVMMGRGLTRYTVRLLDAGRKILVRASNLKPIDSSDPLFAESLAAGQAMDMMNRLYNSTSPVLPTPQGPGAPAAGDGLDAAVGMPAAMGGDGHTLTDQDIRFLQRLNISVVDKAHFWETGHCDGGLGRIMVTPVNIAEEDEGNDLWAEPDADAMLGTRAPPQQPRELLLNLELQRAAACGDADRIETLVSAGADIHTRSFTDSQHGDFGRQPLHVAAWEGHVDACAVLLHMGADVHARDKNNATALHHAAVKGVLPTVEMLLEHGAVPTALNKWNRTCIHRAVFYNHKAVAVRLLDAAGPAYDRREIAAIEKHKILSHKRIDELRHMD